MNNYKRGSEWRKWDLHFHTMSSYDYKDQSITNEEIIEKLKSEKISVTAITDHHIMDIQRINELQNLAGDDIKIFPGIEFLGDARGNEPLHFIGIFPETSNIEHIWGQLENRTAIKDISGSGKKINAIYCDLMDTVALIHELGGVVTVHAGKKGNSVENITHALPHTMAQKEDIASIIDIFEVGKVEDIKSYEEKVFPNINKYIPMVLCSDNHDIKNYVLKASTWIKADPTFKGLLQAINEPQERIFIGEEPPVSNRVKSNSTKYIESLLIEKSDKYKAQVGVWFDNIAIPFNSELVAVIGNKGNGKSAIADILGLCGQSDISLIDYKFLNKEKFRQGKLAQNFQAKIKWRDGIDHDFISLDKDFPEGTVANVKYISQGYFEKLCNEISKTEDFKKELEKVVFQHVAISNRLGTQSFDEYIEKLNKNFENQEKSLFVELEACNNKIILLENKSSSEYKQEIESGFRQKSSELKAHIKNEPIDVVNPSENITEEQRKQKSELEQINEDLKNVEDKIFELQRSHKNLSETIFVIDSIIQELKAKEDELKRYFSEVRNKLIDYGVEASEFFMVTLETKKLESIVEIKTKEIEAIEKKLTDKTQGNLNWEKEKLKTQINDLTQKMSEPERLYHEYLAKKDQWQNDKLSIEGNDNIKGSLKYYEKEKNYIENTLWQEIAENRDKRMEIALKIYDLKLKVQNSYNDIKKAVDHVLQDSKTSLEKYPITIECEIKFSHDFIEKFVEKINLRASGNFRGIDDGISHLNELMENKKFNSESDVILFLTSIIDSLEGSDVDNKKDITRQVKNKKEFYDFLFSLKYLKPNYELMQDGKTLEQLSPGEKGALLLVFYLLLDTDDIPLIIDQPEDNLDNQSVSQILVPFIKQAKKKRQIIMITHNPNLAVVADAEQIIYVRIDKKNFNSFSFVAGSIENKDINDKLVEVLEGTEPAFTKRRIKYHI